jgi:anti-sigma regulatory factor (Ser/Thr protein kinase)
VGIIRSPEARRVMIDLSRNRAELLAEIGATEPAGEPLIDITDPRVATADANVHVCGRGREDLFPLLKIALSERFATVPRMRLIWDLIRPLKNVLGNAYKHGNRYDSTKTMSVELVLTRKGSLIAVTDEGTGFDVALTFRRFQQQQAYFVNHGHGFRNLHRALSTVSYENGGRTVLLCFRPSMRNQDHASSVSPASVGDPTIDQGAYSGGHASHDSGSSRREEAHSSLVRIQNLLTLAATRAKRFTDRAHDSDAAEALAKVLDSKWIQTCLSSEIPEFGDGRARIESCRVYAIRGPADDNCGNRYVLRVASHDQRPAETRILTGRLHATEAAAKADFESATTLREAAISKRVLIPRPVGRLLGEPRLVLYDFDPCMNLWEYLTYRSSLKSVSHAAERIGETLAVMHRSKVALHELGPDGGGGEFRAMVAHAETTLQTLPGGRELADRFRASVARLQQRSIAPIHGALGWDSIFCGVDSRFYLYRFETCRRSDPGIDLGGFAADLLCFTLVNYDEEAYGMCRNTFLSHYNSNAQHPMGTDDLRPYVTLALLERLQRTKRPTNADTEQRLRALDVALRHEGRPAASVVSS